MKLLKEKPGLLCAKIGDLVSSGKRGKHSLGQHALILLVCQVIEQRDSLRYLPRSPLTRLKREIQAALLENSQDLRNMKIHPSISHALVGPLNVADELNYCGANATARINLSTAHGLLLDALAEINEILLEKSVSHKPAIQNPSPRISWGQLVSGF